jgi:hypothetical protein
MSMRNKLVRLRAWCMAVFCGKTAPLSDLQQARALIAAVDAGGIPLNPLRVNVIARNLGLDVSRSAPVEETVERIRAALQRV